MSTKNFFGTLDCQSRIKASIVAKYFSAWASVMYHSKQKQSNGRPFKLGYVDLFCGKGMDDTGYESTPLKIARTVINNPKYREAFVLIYNDINQAYVEGLKRAVETIQDYDKLKHQAQFLTVPVNIDFTESLASIQFVPSLFFLDPWGYKGLSRSLFKVCIKDWGCDFIFFLNYNRVMQALVNPSLKTNMNMIFGEESTEEVSNQLKKVSKFEKYDLIINALKASLKSVGCKYCIDFAFRANRKCSHVLLLASKDPKAYEIMKDIMAKHSRKSFDNISSFDHDTSVGNFLLHPRCTFDSLCTSITMHLARGSKTVNSLFKECHVNTPYTLKNYKDALLLLEHNGTVAVSRPSPRSHRNSMSGECVITLEKDN